MAAYRSGNTQLADPKSVSCPNRLPAGSDQRGTEAHLPWPPPRTLPGASDGAGGISACEQMEGRIVMTSTNDNRFFVPAWGVSLTLHGTVVGLAFAFAAQVKPILQEDLFQWDVALVETEKSASLPEPVESVMTPAQPMAKVVPPSRPKRVTEVSQVVKPLEQQIDSPPPIEQKVEVPQLREEPMEQRIVETATPVAEPAGIRTSNNVN